MNKLNDGAVPWRWERTQQQMQCAASNKRVRRCPYMNGGREQTEQDKSKSAAAAAKTKTSKNKWRMGKQPKGRNPKSEINKAMGARKGTEQGEKQSPESASFA